MRVLINDERLLEMMAKCNLCSLYLLDPLFRRLIIKLPQAKEVKPQSLHKPSAAACGLCRGAVCASVVISLKSDEIVPKELFIFFLCEPLSRFLLEVA